MMLGRPFSDRPLLDCRRNNSDDGEIWNRSGPALLNGLVVEAVDEKMWSGPIAEGWKNRATG